MDQGLKSSYALSQIMQVLYIVFFISLAFAFNYFSSLSIGLILLVGIIKNKIEHKPFFSGNTKNFFLIACVLSYLLQGSSLLYTQHKDETWIHLRIKTALVFVPLALCSPNYLTEITRKKLIHLFSIILFAASFYCLAVNSLEYFEYHDSSVFFFHTLVNPLHQHAVYFSIYTFIILLYLIETIGKKEFILNKSLHIFLIFYFSIFLFLLSSKLVISFYLLYLLYHAITLLADKKKRQIAISVVFVGLLAIILLLTTRNPVSNRFKEILNTDMNLVKQEKFDPGIYFNDVQFRMVEWKLVKEILNENNCWWTGISPGDGQDFLDKKYIEKNMYVGEPSRGDKGYLRYNTHNQLLESLLQSGIAGVLFFLLILFALIRMAWLKRNRLLSFTIILLIAFSFIESAFETQYAIMLFTFFPLFLSLDGKQQ